MLMYILMWENRFSVTSAFNTSHRDPLYKSLAEVKWDSYKELSWLSEWCRVVSSFLIEKILEDFNTNALQDVNSNFCHILEPFLDDSQEEFLMGSVWVPLCRYKDMWMDEMFGVSTEDQQIHRFDATLGTSTKS